MKAGDANTKFFHLKATARRNRNYITKLAVGPSTFFDHSSIARSLRCFFAQHLSSEDLPRPSLDFDGLFGVEYSDLQGLHAPFTEAEVKRAVFNSPPDKAPGPDGFPILFYQQFWGTLKGDIMGIFNRFHSGQLDLATLNRNWICLIPKTVAPLNVRDYRPISLVNGLAKIISKVLASRLQGVLGSLINPFQTAFVKGRLLLDNFLTAHVLAHHLHSSKTRAALLKIDFDRAFDQVSWDFLLEVLRARRFNPIWIGWIRAILHSTSAAVLLNGTPGNFFQCSRGLRQGDPLSPLLFILCVDVLYRMMDRVVHQSLLATVGIEEVRVHTL